MDAFSNFLSLLDEALRAAGLTHAWPAFVVGRVGTELHTGTFAPDAAGRLAACARTYGAGLKGHYTDHVDDPRAYPLSGVAGANVGPEFTGVEYDALMDLAALERRLERDAGLDRALRGALLQSGRWKKWLQPDEAGAAFDGLAPARQDWLLRTGCRYIWTHPEVEAARQDLYEHVRDHADGPAFVHWRVKDRILHYLHTFNLVGFASMAR